MVRFSSAFLLAGLASVILSPGPSAAATPRSQHAIPATAVVPDPRLGPNAADEARHAGQAITLAPATSKPIPLSHLSVYASSPSLLAASATPFHREVFGFAPYWALNQNSTWNYRLLTTLTYFGLTLNRDGNIDTTVSGYSEWSSQDLVTIINNAHAAGDRVLVTVKQFQTEAINRVVTDPALTNVAIGNIMNAIAAMNLDGVNIDFEGQTSSTYPLLQTGLTTFMTQLSQTVHAKWPNAEVTIDTYTGAASWDGGIFNITNLAPVVDAFFIMAYDMPFDDYVGHAAANAPMTNFLYNDTLAVQQYLTKAPASKIILGVPYYGYKWSVTGNGPNAPVTSGATADNYANIVSEIACHPQYMTTNWDSLAESPWLAWYSPATNDPCDGNFGSWRELYYDNATSLGLKYDLVNQNNLRGAGMWALGYDGGATELWNEIAQKLTTVTPWDSLNGLTNADPGLSAASATRLDAMMRGTNNAIWQNTWNGASWAGWSSLGGYLSLRPSTIDVSPTRVDVFARGEDGAMWHRYWDGTTWQPWASLGGNITSGPSSA
ncbi:MAG: glycosyl hydrolase family 18 protein, partial [Candidatus Dormibacteraceae bacterium]